MLNPYNDASVLGTHVPLVPSGLLSGLGATARVRRSGPVQALLSHGPEISDCRLHWEGLTTRSSHQSPRKTLDAHTTLLCCF